MPNLTYWDVRPGLARLEMAIWNRSCDTPTYEGDTVGQWYGSIRLHGARADRAQSTVVTVR